MSCRARPRLTRSSIKRCGQRRAHPRQLDDPQRWHHPAHSLGSAAITDSERPRSRIPRRRGGSAQSLSPTSCATRGARDFNPIHHGAEYPVAADFTSGVPLSECCTADCSPPARWSGWARELPGETEQGSPTRYGPATYLRAGPGPRYAGARLQLGGCGRPDVSMADRIDRRRRRGVVCPVSDRLSEFRSCSREQGETQPKRP